MAISKTRAFIVGSLSSLALCAAGCGGSDDTGDGDADSTSDSVGDDSDGPPVEVENPLTDPESGPPAGNLDGACDIPAEAGPEDVTSPTTVVGDGTKESCTGDAFIAAVATGGVITFDCGAEPVTIELNSPAKVFNDASEKVVIDGGGLVSLSGKGKTRILYMNTCDEAQHWTTDHCNNQEFPQLTVQNITFIDANSSGVSDEGNAGGGGAIWVRGGRFKAVNTRFFNNVCAAEGQDLGGAGIRVLDQFDKKPIYVVNSTFGGAEGLGNSCANGGGISSIDQSWTIINSLFSYNEATGHGGNPAAAGTEGGGSGGAIYNDGLTITLSLCGSLIEENTVVSYGQAIFFVSNNHTGTLKLRETVITSNHGGSWYDTLPAVSMHPDTIVDIDDASIVE